MPRVVPNQRERFENDELFRKLSRDLEIRYTGFRERPLAERRMCLQAECRDGHATIAVIGLGLNLNLNFYSPVESWAQRLQDNSGSVASEYVDFNREPNKVHLKSHFILNGVCVTWKGWIDLRRLDGVGRFEFDTERAQMEDAVLRDAELGNCSPYNIDSDSRTFNERLHSTLHHGDHQHLQQQQQQQLNNASMATLNSQQVYDADATRPGASSSSSNRCCTYDNIINNTVSSNSSSSSSTAARRDVHANYVMCYDDVSN